VLSNGNDHVVQKRGDDKSFSDHEVMRKDDEKTSSHVNLRTRIMSDKLSEVGGL
jgi:hypothetical protein